MRSRARRPRARTGASPMKLFVGLGNPGNKYARNRHNVGFMARRPHRRRSTGSAPWKKRFQGLDRRRRDRRRAVVLLKPQTYMNDSGRSVGEAARFLKISEERYRRLPRRDRSRARQAEGQDRRRQRRPQRLALDLRASRQRLRARAHRRRAPGHKEPCRRLGAAAISPRPMPIGWSPSARRGGHGSRRASRRRSFAVHVRVLTSPPERTAGRKDRRSCAAAPRPSRPSARLAAAAPLANANPSAPTHWPKIWPSGWRDASHRTECFPDPRSHLRRNGNSSPPPDFWRDPSHATLTRYRRVTRLSGRSDGLSWKHEEGSIPMSETLPDTTDMDERGSGNSFKTARRLRAAYRWSDRIQWLSCCSRPRRKSASPRPPRPSWAASRP